MEIGNRLQLSPGTVTNVTSQLLSEGIVNEIGQVESRGGRPRAILQINPDYGYLVGVDFGETHLELMLFNLQMEKLGEIRLDISIENLTLDHYLDQIDALLKNLISKYQIEKERMIGVGLAVPGVVIHSNQVRVASPMWDWQAIEYSNKLEEKIGLPVYIDNGAKAMALAESWFGVGKGIQNLAVILIGTGVGAGFITGGELYRGATNSAGEFGHTKIVLDGRLCRCGSQGCLEAYVGAPGIIQSLHVQEHRHLEKPEDQFQLLQKIFRDSQENKQQAVQTLRQTAQFLGAGLANLVNLFNPELIVIGGWVGLLLGAAIMDDVIAYTRRYSLPPSITGPGMCLCDLREDAICTGAACLVFQEFISGNPKFIIPYYKSNQQGSR